MITGAVLNLTGKLELEISIFSNLYNVGKKTIVEPLS